MSPASNTHDAFSDFIGQKVVGVLFNALPANRRDIASGTKTLVFDDGRGLTFAGNGSFWIDSVEEVRRATDVRRRELEATQRELAGVLELAGGES
jgi:hypothetical protein